MGKVKLYDALKASYGHKNNEANLIKNGYIKDNELSSHNQSVYYNPKKKKILYGVAGTHNLTDIGTDILLARGKLKDSKRFKEAEEVLKKSKEKYHPAKTTLVGHSLGASITSYLGDDKDKRHTLDAGYTIGQPTRNNGHRYRTQGDIVSIFGANATHMKSLNNPHNGSNYFFKAHDIDNIVNHELYV